jgi:hypothetical protein
MKTNSLLPSLISCLCLLTLSSPSPAQDSKTGATKGRETIEARIKRQHKRINNGLEQGTINKAQAAQLNSGLDDLEAKITSQKQQNGGHLKPEQVKQAENSLNQSNEVIRSYENAGKSAAEPGNVLGPKWTPGQDGAQKSAPLLKQMKQMEKRELRQEKQANEQTLEQQQLDYEKSMMNKFSEQRQSVLKKKSNLKQERQDTGAN